MATILIVDDKDVNRKLIVAQLSLMGHQLLQASNGEEALSLAANNHVDLIITDIMMPVMDGFELVYNLNQNPDLKHIKVIFYSAEFIEPDAINLAKDSGVCYFAQKPLESDEITKIVDAVLRSDKKIFPIKSIEKLHERHNKLVTNKLHEKTLKLESLNHDLEKRIAEKTKELEGINQELSEKSMRDALTNLGNRRYLDEMLGREIARMTRQKKQLAVIMIDIDHFKDYNDRFHHDTGDDILKEVGTCLQKCSRQEDILCRYGGDEFIVVLIDINKKEILQWIENLQNALKKIEVVYEEKPSGHINVSMGVAIFPVDGKNQKELIHLSDEALYSAKQSGRNKAVFVT